MLLAFHGKPELKDAVLAIIAEHEQADRIVSGTYAKFDRKGKFSGGCAVGCTLESIRRIEGLNEIEYANHALYERYLGVPRVLARLEDAIFESRHDDEALAWPRRFTQAIRPGADLSMVWVKFLHRLLSDPEGAVQTSAAKRPQVAAAVEAVVGLYGRWMDGAKPPVEEWMAARKNAYADAAADAAYAAYAAADAAAYAAAYAADAAAAAACAAACVAAYGAASLRERRRQADLLIDLLESAPVVTQA